MEQDNARLKRESIILSLLPDPVVAITMEGKITFANAQTERMLRLNRSEVVGTNIDEFVANDSKAEFQQMISEVINAERRLAVQDDSGTELEGDGKDMNIGVSLTAKQTSADENMTDSDQSNMTAPQPRRSSLTKAQWMMMRNFCYTITGVNPKNKTWILTQSPRQVAPAKNKSGSVLLALP